MEDLRVLVELGPTRSVLSYFSNLGLILSKKRTTLRRRGKSSGEKIALRPACFFFRAMHAKKKRFLIIRPGRPVAFSFPLPFTKKHFGHRYPSEKIPPQLVHGFLFRAMHMPKKNISVIDA